MTDTNQLPPLPTPKFTETIRGVPCITVTEHEHLIRAYALQALAQVQGDPFGYIHHYVAHDNSGVIIDTTWEADGCADAMPHPTHPAAWKWSHATPFYTTPQPAQATQAEVTGLLEAFDEAVAQELPRVSHVEYDSHEICKHFASKVRAILALRPAAVPMTDEHLSVLKEMADRCPELNLRNYDSDDVDELNGWAVAIAVYIDGITAQAKKETP